MKKIKVLIALFLGGILMNMMGYSVQNSKGLLIVITFSAILFLISDI